MSSLEQRVADLEEQLRGKVELKQLPLAALKRKLASELTPDADTFLLPKSVGNDSLEDDAVNYRVMGDFIERVSALPSSPFDGQVVEYVADDANGVTWLLRYNSDAAYWECIGGAPLIEEVGMGAADESTNSATYAALTSAGPTITVPLDGDYIVEIGCNAYNNTNGDAAFMSYDIGGTGAVNDDAVFFGEAGGSNSARASMAKPRRKDGLTASTALTAKYKVDAGIGNFRDRWMRVMPVRVA